MKMNKEYSGWNSDLKDKDLDYVIGTLELLSLFSPTIFSESLHYDKINRRQRVHLYRCASWYDRDKILGYIETKQDSFKFSIKVWGEDSLERTCRKLEKRLKLLSG